ncbi:hypothetical protein LAZ67_1002652, partial [Cordylochernes scorpioides]
MISGYQACSLLMVSAWDVSSSFLSPLNHIRCWTPGPIQEGHDVRGLAGPVVGRVGAVTFLNHRIQIKLVKLLGGFTPDEPGYLIDVIIAVRTVEWDLRSRFCTVPWSCSISGTGIVSTTLSNTSRHRLESTTTHWPEDCDTSVTSVPRKMMDPVKF